MSTGGPDSPIGSFIYALAIRPPTNRGKEPVLDWLRSLPVDDWSAPLRVDSLSS